MGCGDELFEWFETNKITWVTILASIAALQVMCIGIAIYILSRIKRLKKLRYEEKKNNSKCEKKYWKKKLRFFKLVNFLIFAGIREQLPKNDYMTLLQTPAVIMITATEFKSKTKKEKKTNEKKLVTWN